MQEESVVGAESKFKMGMSSNPPPEFANSKKKTDNTK
jgi:hypothetical protein